MESPIGLGDFERVDAREARGVIDQAIDASKVLFHLDKEALDFWDLFQISLKYGYVATFGGGGASRIRGIRRSGWRLAPQPALAAMQCRAQCVWRCR